MELTPGLYELLIDKSVDTALEKLVGLKHEKSAIDPGESHDILAAHLERIINQVLQSQVGDDKLKKQADIFNRVVEILACSITEFENARLGEPLRLMEIRNEDENPRQRADTPLSQSCILTRTRQDPTLESQLKKEIDSADEIDILCSFIKWTGIRRLKDELTAFTGKTSAQLRVLTTSYMGATDEKAVSMLEKLTNTSVKVSYDHERTRLHAKAYIFRRKSGFGTAYVGSSNISHAALTDGLEWNVKISQYETPHLWDKLLGAFQTHWYSPEFETFTAASQQKLLQALKQVQGDTQTGQSTPLFDLRPYPFQQEILDRIAVERLINERSAHLVVAATGTGKTLIAAFDYLHYCKGCSNNRPTLLFVAHSEEILKQSLAVFRAVLKDYNFGDLLVGGNKPADTRHLFMSIQSFASARRSGSFVDVRFYDYIVIDEFHHAAARTYDDLLDHFHPQCLLGLTATPERSDGLDILKWFGGHISAQIRLPDAVNRKLLCPFQYFGVTDSVDLSDIRWVRGGYATQDLEHLYTLTEFTAKTRVDLICSKLDEYLLDPHRAKALGFCVSIEHAEFMAKAFIAKGLRAEAITGRTDQSSRSSVRNRLNKGEVNYVFTVDLFNEGVDIPEIDTVLFLRPTESLTIFLQQLGRGLRHSENKECLTVLDFIGQANKKYRFDVRYRALLDDPSKPIAKEVRQGFAHLPAGCSIHLEKKAQDHILHNISSNIAGSSSRLSALALDIFNRTDAIPTLAQFLSELEMGTHAIYKFTSWSQILVKANIIPDFNDPDKEILAKGFAGIQHIDGIKHIRFLIRLLESHSAPNLQTAADKMRLDMMLISLFGSEILSPNPIEALTRLNKNSTLKAELIELLKYKLDSIDSLPAECRLPFVCPLELHSLYTRDEVLTALGFWTLSHRPDMREGVRYLSSIDTDVLFVTLNKTETDYSPSTMYADYAISDTLFHWQSQSGTSDTSPTGKRYINQSKTKSTVLLFVRQERVTDGLANPYHFLGPADIYSYSGSRPMNIVWKLRTPMPARLLRETSALVAA